VSVSDTQGLLAAGGYVADRALATTVHLALAMQRPLFLEGEPGTGKTEIAKVLSAGLGRPLVRLQCYDGLDLSAAAYEWNAAKQLMAIRMAEGGARLPGPPSPADLDAAFRASASGEPGEGKAAADAPEGKASEAAARPLVVRAATEAEEAEGRR
jgi:MoxR-like ATPase